MDTKNTKDTNLLKQLSKSKTEEERWKIIIQTLPEELSQMVWASAVPHWFNKLILEALLPTIKDEPQEIYQQLIKLPFVQDFPERGHNIFQSNRKVILRYLWGQKHEQFITISNLAKEYFEKEAHEQKSEAQIEYLYHLVVVNPNQGAEKVKEICAEWNNQFRFAELEYLVNTLLEQVVENRVQGLAKAVIFYRQARVAFRLDQPHEVLEQILENLSIAIEQSHQDRYLLADILQAKGDTLVSLNRDEQAIQLYNDALNLYKEQNDHLNIANVQQSLGKIYYQSQLYLESLGYYESALNLFYNIDDKLGQANALHSIGDVLREIKNHKSSRSYNSVYSKLNQSPIYSQVIGDRIKFCEPKKLYLLFYQKASKLYRRIGYKFIAKTIKDRTEKTKKSNCKGRNPNIRFPKKSTIMPREIPDLIRFPIITEKATILLEDNKYIFTVKPSAIKPDIKKAIESLFNVKVIKVNTLNPPKQKRRVGKFEGYKPHYKKAIVTLAEGDFITLFPEV